MTTTATKTRIDGERIQWIVAGRARQWSGAIRFKPIFLTAAAAMIGAAFILSDPIFQGLAISMVFGLASSTALTLLVIPAIYIWLRDDGVAQPS